MFKKIKDIFSGKQPESPFQDELRIDAPEAVTPPPTENAIKGEVVKPKAPRKPRSPKKKSDTVTKEKSPKEIATEKGEPYVAVLSVEIDPENVHDGAFELDWNDKFITNLVRAGYQGRTDSDMVDRWFQDVCRNIVLENFEQWDANYVTQRRIDKQDLGDGKTSVS